MRRSNLILISIVVLPVMLAGIVACKKYKDPAKPDVDLEDRRYCNNPLAVNFNWGFPGIPDSTTCIFPVDKFAGAWIFGDSVYAQDGTLQEVITKTLVFTPTEDTVLTHLEVAGWCAGPAKILVTADRYGKALTDTLLEFTPGQLICIETDTINGVFQQFNGINDTMKVDMTLNTASGIRYHRGTAIRQ